MDAEFGPFFLTFCSSFPDNATLCVNGHEWAKRHATRAGIAVTALDNGFATVDDPAALAAICDQFGVPPRFRTLLGPMSGIWEARHTLTGHTNSVNSVAFSPDAHTLATASTDQTARL